MPIDVLLEASVQRQFDKAPKHVRDALRTLAPKLASDPQWGEYVSPKQVPNKRTLQKWERRVGPMANLYKLELPRAWRALYTTKSRGSERVVMVLEVVDHKEYDRLMGYA